MGEADGVEVRDVVDILRRQQRRERVESKRLELVNLIESRSQGDHHHQPSISLRPSPPASSQSTCHTGITDIHTDDTMAVNVITPQAPPTRPLLEATLEITDPMIALDGERGNIFEHPSSSQTTDAKPITKVKKVEFSHGPPSQGHQYNTSKNTATNPCVKQEKTTFSAKDFFKTYATHR